MKHLMVIAACLFLARPLLATTPTQPATFKMDFPKLLSAYAPQFSLHFTLEGDETQINSTKPAAESLSPYHFRTLTLPDTFKDADDFLNHLRQALPDVDITKDDALPNIVHLRQKSLANRPNYFLDEKTDFLYQATLGEFLSDIAGESDWTFEQDNLYFGALIILPDTRLPVQINLKNASYRTILSAAILRPDAPTILWSSRTVQKEGRLVSVFKPGPLKLTAAEEKRAANPPDTLPAEIALAMNQRNDAQRNLNRTISQLVAAPDAPVITETNVHLVDRTTDTLTLRIPLRNIPAQALLNDLRPLLAPDTKSAALPDPNSLILRDTSARLHQYLQITNSLEDAAGFQRAAAVAQGADPQGINWTKTPHSLPASRPPPTTLPTTLTSPTNPLQISPNSPPTTTPSDRFLAPIYSGSDPAKVETSDRWITQIIPLTHITPASTADEIKKAGLDTVIAQSNTANCLIISGKAAQVHQLMQVLEKLDK